jgi:hypothetical protein
VVDWEEAFAYYAALAPAERSYRAVAGHFGISPRTVERHGREERWGERLREIEAQVEANTNAAIAETRIEQMRNTIRLVEATLIGYADKLRRGDVRMVPGDLEKLHRLLGQVTIELDSPVGRVPPDAPPAARSPEHIEAVIDALVECGALDALGLTRVAPPAASESESG